MTLLSGRASVALTIAAGVGLVALAGAAPAVAQSMMQAPGQGWGAPAGQSFAPAAPAQAPAEAPQAAQPQSAPPQVMQQPQAEAPQEQPAQQAPQAQQAQQGGPAMAPGCEKLQTLLIQRKGLVDNIQKLTRGGKKMDARSACTAFGRLVSNGTETAKWLDANKAWCQIPDSFINGLKEDNGNAANFRGQACKVAAQQTEMEKRARAEAAAGGGGGGGGLLGGPGLTGQRHIPQGAL